MQGRYFSEAEDESKPLVVIINQTMAEKYFPGEDPIGKQIFYSVPPLPPMQIVGVIADIKEGPLDSTARPALYAPFNQEPSRYFSVAVRTSQPAPALLPVLAATIHRMNSEITISDEFTMTELVDRSPAAYLHRSSAWLVGSFAAMAFLLSVVGLYGVIAYSVSQRTREIGVRMALGAQPQAVYRLILKEAASLAGAGTALGMILALGTAKLMHSLLFGVSAWDIPTLAIVAAVLILSALLASHIPAHRAASVNPIEALRAE